MLKPEWNLKILCDCNKHIHNNTCMHGGHDEIMDGGATKRETKWHTLQHNGIMFYPEYTKHDIPLLYDTKEVNLNIEAEEYATYYADPKYDMYKNPKFNKNFWKDWSKLIDKSLNITDFNKCDFSLIKKYLMDKKLEKKMTKKTPEELKLEKEEKNKLMEKYKYAIVDGKRQPIDNYIAEPPSLFIGRGCHPLSGRIKFRIQPEDVVINIGKGEPLPGDHKWGGVIHDNQIEWIASWQNNVTLKYNYSRFGKKSEFKMKSDIDKFDKARKLKRKIKKIREINEKYISGSDDIKKQLATALYLIDTLAIRVGNEKGSDESDTVGATTLKVENIKLLTNNIVELDFLGKDSVRYHNKFVVTPEIYKNLEEYIKDKSQDDLLFDKISSLDLNKYLKRFMKGLTAKVFRTYNASSLFQKELDKIAIKYKDYDKDDLIDKILHEYALANLKVAKLCNHQKAVAKNASEKSKKINESLKELKRKLNKAKKTKSEYIENNKDTKAINEKINKINLKIKKAKMKREINGQSASLAIGTSRQNYIDPRITISFMKKTKLMDSLNKIFSQQEIERFKWAIDDPEIESYHF